MCRFHRAFAVVVLPFLVGLPGCAPAPEPVEMDPVEVIAEMASNGNDLAEVLAAVDAWLETNPESRARLNVFQHAVTAAARLDPEGTVLPERIERYVDAFLEGGIAAMAYSRVSRTLLDAGGPLEMAGQYADKAFAEFGGARVGVQRGTVMETLARVRFAQGDTAQAIAMQRQALEQWPGNVPYLEALADYLRAADQTSEAAGHYAEAALIAPDEGKAIARLRELADDPSVSGGAADQWLARVFGETADRMLAASEEPEAFRVTLAKSFAKIGVLTDRAMAYARDAVEANGPDAGIRDYIDARISLAVVEESLGRHEAALATIEPLQGLVSFSRTDYHLTRGAALEAMGRREEALNAYLDGDGERPEMRERLEPLWAALRRGQDLDAAIAAHNDAMAIVEPEGTFVAPGDWSGKVVLAEFFTGAQCGPCAGPDIAYDGLLAFYPGSTLAVLEHHVHIPSPDPMVNPDVVERRDYYGIDGAPTSILNGTERLNGGGRRRSANFRYEMFRWMIDRAILGEPGADLTLDGRRAGRTVHVSASVVARSGLADYRNLRLRVALAERRVDYTGLNGIAQHSMVTRAFIGGAAGVAVGTNGRAKFDERIDLDALEARALGYLDDFEAHPPDNYQGFGGFDEKKHEIDETGLVLVAFVQNDATKAVLQARVFDLR